MCIYSRFIAWSTGSASIAIDPSDIVKQAIAER